MDGFVARWVVNALAIYITTRIVKGIDVSGFGPALIGALILGVVNATLKPLLIVLTLPINLLSLGLFTFVINGLMLMAVSSLVSGFEVDGLLAAIIGSIVISIFSYLIGGVVGQ